MTQVDDQDAAVVSAEDEATAAEDLVAALEERVRDGDDKIKPDQIEQQRGLARFARLRAEAARRKADQARADQLARKQEKARQDARDLLAAHSIDKLGELHNAAVDALVALIDSQLDRVAAIREAAQILSKGEVPVSQIGPQGWTEPEFEGERLNPSTSREVRTVVEDAVFDVHDHFHRNRDHYEQRGIGHGASNPLHGLLEGHGRTHKGRVRQAGEHVRAGSAD